MQCVSRLIRLQHIAAPALDRAACGLCPEQQIALRIVGRFACQRSRAIGERGGVGRDVG